MKSVLTLTGLWAFAAIVTAVDDDACEADVEVRQTSTVALEASVATFASNTTNVFAPVVAPHVNTQNDALLIPQNNVSLYYASNISVGGLVINHTMAAPTVLLEQIASISSVDCTAESVAVTFNDSSVFALAQNAWTTSKNFVLVTNHLGDCDPELERSFFLVESMSFDDESLVVTASSTKTNVSSTASESSGTTIGLYYADLE